MNLNIQSNKFIENFRNEIKILSIYQRKLKFSEVQNQIKQLENIMIQNIILMKLNQYWLYQYPLDEMNWITEQKHEQKTI